MPRPTGERRDRPTMHDVAERSGVSLKSVSRVINDESGASPQTRTRVWTAIRELGYQRNDTAHALRRRDGRSACLGVVLDDVGNTFAAAVHSGVVQVANTHRCLVLAASTHGDPDIERQLVYRLLGRRVDGLVIMSARTDHSYLTGELERGVPIVFVDRPARGIRATSVLAANRAATREAVEHLIAHGHRRIAFLSDWPTLYTTAQRHRGYLDAHHAHKLPVQRDLHRSGLVDAASTQHALSTLLTGQDPPTRARESGRTTRGQRPGCRRRAGRRGRPWCAPPCDGARCPGRRADIGSGSAPHPSRGSRTAGGSDRLVVHGGRGVLRGGELQRGEAIDDHRFVHVCLYELG